ncbi:relaxase MobL [Paenibacillus amylolyticus]|uniref:relaxase MobL n=1 Tax=Paenibacillus amylolyticus TaxID=1451 RepID=UPI00201DB4A2|nr:relaxase MobL [Paenibacillus amylolyticus]MCL6663438.1 relaxase MobL [Paenibacillus amylolyticus]
MGMKQDIVIKSEYTNNARSSTGKGSRGSSPGQYVMGYMAREDATEVLVPVRMSVTAGAEGYAAYDSAAFTRYMARDQATERLISKDDEDLQNADAYGSPLVLKQKFRQIDKLSGRAFGRGGISLTHKELERHSQSIQNSFDEGHSVQKIVLSFTEDYLRETGVLDPEFKHKGRGSYRGHIDQLKLRHAVMNGVERMTTAGRFIDPEWVGTIQLDTSHVHVHIALADTKFSKTRMKSDGADRGKINEREKAVLRKGIHFDLEDMSQLKSFNGQASLERRNVVAFVKDYAYATLHENSSIQLLVAGLPKNKKEWRYGSNRKSMNHSNKLAVQIIEKVFAADPDKSGYNKALQAVLDYADESSAKNKLSDGEKKKLIKEGRERIIERSVNGLYKTLKGIDPTELTTRTTMTDIQSSSDEELAQALKQSNRSGAFDPATFALRVRGYNTRENVHSKSVGTYYALATDYDVAQEKGFVDDTAHVMRLFYEEELEFHMGLADKYRTFMSFHHNQDVANVQRMTPRYDSLVSRFKGIAKTVSETLRFDQRTLKEYARDLRDYTMDCFKQGVASLKEWRAITDYDREAGTVETRFVLPVRPKTRAENLSPTHFDTVKAWDVHHLGLDYYNKPDARIDTKNALTFAGVFQARKQQAEAAEIYVKGTGQELQALSFAKHDIEDMEQVVQKAMDEGLIQTVKLADLNPQDERQLYTLSLDRSVNVARQVRQSLEHVEMIEQEEELE